MVRATIAALFVITVACVSTQPRPRCGEFSPAPPPRVVPGLASSDSTPGLASAVLVISELCTGRRIPGAFVRFIDAAAGSPSTGTDSTGLAVLRGRAGTHEVRITAFGFYPDTIAVPLGTMRRDSVFVSLRLAQSLLDRIGPGAPPANDACCRQAQVR